MGENFNVYETGLDNDEIESKIIGLENDYINLDLSQEIRNDIKQSLLDTIKELPIEKQKTYKSEYQNKAINGKGKLKGLYYELAAGIINVISGARTTITSPVNKNNLQENSEINIKDSNMSIIDGNITINQIITDGKSRVDLKFVKFDVPKLKKSKVNVELNTILEQKIGDGKIHLKFGNKYGYEPKIVDLNYQETSTHITFYYDGNENGSLDRYESENSKSILKKTMRSQHDVYYYTANINLHELGIPGIKRGNIYIKIEKTD